MKLSTPSENMSIIAWNRKSIRSTICPNISRNKYLFNSSGPLTKSTFIHHMSKPQKIRKLFSKISTDKSKLFLNPSSSKYKLRKVSYTLNYFVPCFSSQESNWESGRWILKMKFGWKILLSYKNLKKQCA